MSPPITAVILAKNEEAAIARCVESASFCDQVLVIDSHSTDRTVERAERAGAEVIPFSWNGEYPKKKQWGMSHPAVRHNWVLHLDADEVVPRDLAAEMTQEVLQHERTNVSAFDIPLRYHFSGKALRHGHQVVKRALVDRRVSRFPEVGDLAIPGITEVEGHYQPVVQGTAKRLNNVLIHDDPDPLGSWLDRHNRYAEWEAHLRIERTIRSSVRGRRSRGGQLFDRLPGKPLAFFLYSYVARAGFLDGRAGFDYAFALAFYYWLIDAKTRELTRAQG